AFVGQYRLARALDVSRPAASFAALVVTWSGFSVAHLMQGHVTLILGYALVPWFLLALVKLTRDPSPRTAAAMACVVALLALAGHPQVPYYAILFGSLWAAGALAVGAAAAHRVRFIVWSGVAAALAILLASVQLVPAWELVRDGAAYAERGTVAHAAMFAPEPLDLQRFLVPNFRGNPLVGLPEFQPPDYHHEKVGYLGLAVPLLMLYGLTRARARRWEYGSAVLCLFAIVIALGNSTPVFAVLGRIVPGLLLFRCPARTYSVLSILAALVAARGLDALIERRPRAGRNRLVGVGLAAWLIVNAAAWLLIADVARFGWTDYGAFYDRHVRPEWIAAAVLLVASTCGLLAVRRFAAQRRPWVFVVLLALVVADLSWGSVRNFRLAHETRPTIPGDLLALDPPIRFVHVPHPDRLTLIDLRYSHMVAPAVGDRRAMIGTNEGGVFPASVERLHRAVARRGDAALAIAACQYRCVGPEHTWQPVPGALARIRFLPESQRRFAETPIEEVQLEDDLSEPIPIHVRQDDSSKLVVELAAPSAGLLVVADTFYPGWQCLVDGTAREIVPVHGVFRGVELDRGKQRVEFRFRPASFRWGLVATTAGLLLTLGLIPIRRPVAS
ncbi:MAG TPA: 6-pyruvoyl-tetrahydropterin synthase-related protein, partial [Planctomycetaceae bacterium]|nr:6-pyruvoyl-tetrahydropterin synthase-related protein [Planctomycetaceae bacterium]